jgi:hypothetical protein
VFAAVDALQAGCFHQTSYTLAADTHPLITKFSVDAWRSIGAPRTKVDQTNPVCQDCVFPRALGRWTFPWLGRAATHSTRWWRPPAVGTSWLQGSSPDLPSRTRRFRR